MKRDWNISPFMCVAPKCFHCKHALSKECVPDRCKSCLHYVEHQQALQLVRSQMIADHAKDQK